MEMYYKDMFLCFSVVLCPAQAETSW